jgi:type IV pilus assembly protein PilE
MSRQKQTGFTLIELMIVVVVIGILAMIAYPSYQESIRETRRADGQALLMSIVNAEERYFTQNNSYTSDLTDLGYTAATNVDSEEGFYKASAAACTGATIATCVDVTGTAQGTQAADGNLTLNSRGQKTPAAKW